MRIDTTTTVTTSSSVAAVGGRHKHECSQASITLLDFAASRDLFLFNLAITSL